MGNTFNIEVVRMYANIGTPMGPCTLRRTYDQYKKPRIFGRREPHPYIIFMFEELDGITIDEDLTTIVDVGMLSTYLQCCCTAELDRYLRNFVPINYGDSCINNEYVLVLPRTTFWVFDSIMAYFSGQTKDKLLHMPEGYIGSQKVAWEQLVDRFFPLSMRENAVFVKKQGIREVFYHTRREADGSIWDMIS